MPLQMKTGRAITAVLVGCVVILGCAGTPTRMTREGLNTNRLVNFEHWGLESVTVEEITAIIAGEWCLIGKGVPIKGVDVHQVEMYEFFGTSDCSRERYRFGVDGSFRRVAGRSGERDELQGTYEFNPETSTLTAPGFEEAFLVDISRGYMIVMLNPELGRMGIVHVFGKMG